jgi:hypothetical protein
MGLSLLMSAPLLLTAGAAAAQTGNISSAGANEPLTGAQADQSCASVNKNLAKLARQGVRHVECFDAAAASGAAAQVGAAAQYWCASKAPQKWWTTRTSICITGPGRYEVLTSKGVVIGEATFAASGEIDTAVNSTTWTVRMSTTLVSVWGTIKAMELELAAGCSAPCSPASRIILPNTLMEPGETRTGEVTFSDHPRPGPDTMAVTLKAWMTEPGKPQGSPIAHTAPTVRCDNLFGNRRAGCVIPSYTPTLTSMASLPAIAANIARIQKAGPHHYGDQALGGLPLTRTTSTKVENANRSTACPASRKRPRGKSCDEYPFAKTWQGASKTTPPDWGWAWVPVSEQNSQGGLLGAFYAANRILNNDAFWVKV